MDQIHVNDRVVVKANPIFKGVVLEAAADGRSGYVKIDDGEDPRTYFHADELEPEPAPS